MRVAVIGANGQVGAEVCLLLARQPGVEVVPIVRNSGGSAFLRYHGIPCRHGLLSDPAQAPKLIGDCDVIANFALASGSPRDAHIANRKIIENATAFSPVSARILYFSTMSVYRSLHAGVGIGFRSAYGKEKLSCEATSRQQGRKFGKEVYVLRLGHVTGDLQNISLLLRDVSKLGPVPLPDPERKSNTTHVVTIANAIMQIAKGSESPGIYDLHNVPHWTWRKVMEHEAAKSGALLRLVPIMSKRGTRARLIKTIAEKAIKSSKIKAWAAPIIAQLNARLGERLQAWYYQSRAATEISALHYSGESLECFQLNEVGTRFMRTLSLTEELLVGCIDRPSEQALGHAWPADLPEANGIGALVTL